MDPKPTSRTSLAWPTNVSQASKTREPIHLRQYRPQTVALSPDELQAVLTVGPRLIAVSPSSESGKWTLTAAHHVGTLELAGRPVLIRPKIPPKNLFTLLQVGMPDGAWRAESFGYDEEAGLLPAVVSWFSRLVEAALGRGLLRSYSQQHEHLLAMRGRVDIGGLFRRPGIDLPVPCVFDEFTADIIENTYLRAAIRLTLRIPGVPDGDRRRLRRELARLEEVNDAAVRPDDLDRVTFTRLNRHYEPALRLARVLLENLTLVDRAGKTHAAAFLLDMNVLFERFVTARLTELLRGRLDVRPQTHAHLGAGRQVLMRPDLEFHRADSTVYVADTKYKLTDDGAARTADYYQLLAYTTALDLPEGALIYCRDASGEIERAVTVRGSGKRLMTYALDLGGTSGEIEAELARLADWLADRVRGVRCAAV